MLLAPLPVNESGIHHGECRATRGGFREHLECLVGVSVDPTPSVFEPLPPHQHHHRLPQRPQRLPPRPAHHRRRTEVRLVERRRHLGEYVVREGREVPVSAAGRRGPGAEADGAGGICGGEFGGGYVWEGERGERRGRGATWPRSVLHVAACGECGGRRTGERDGCCCCR